MINKNKNKSDFENKKENFFSEVKKEYEIIDKNSGAKKSSYIYTYAIVDKNGKTHLTHKKVTSVYVPVCKDNDKILQNNYREIDILLSTLRKMYVRCITYKNRNIEKNVYSANKESSPEMEVIETLLYELQHVNAEQSLHELLIEISKNTLLLAQIRETDKKLIDNLIRIFHSHGIDIPFNFSDGDNLV